MVRQQLPFPATLLYSEDDPYCAPSRARGLSDDWGATAHGMGAAGHLNGESGLGDWPDGWAHLPARQGASR
jgi:predicted alpha/beta hydrolase family esterase